MEHLKRLVFYVNFYGKHCKISDGKTCKSYCMSKQGQFAGKLNEQSGPWETKAATWFFPSSLGKSLFFFPQVLQGGDWISGQVRLHAFFSFLKNSHPRICFY